LTIITSEPSSLVIGKDTVKNITTSKLLKVDRNKRPITVKVYKDSLTKTININSKNSIAFWSNLGFCYGLGMLLDMNNPKRYAYPKTVYINVANKDSSYLTYNPLDKHLNILKITPLKIVGLDFPSIEISYERRTNRNFSTQLMASYLLPNGLSDIGYEFKPNIKGFRLSIEEKYYLEKSAPFGPYVSFEFNYLNNQYRDVWNFGIKNIYSDTSYNNTNYPDTFGIKKQTYSFNFKLGYQIIVKRLSFDFYAGLGLRYKDVRHFDRINPNDKMEMPRHPNFYYITNLEGKYWTISIPLNVRIGWTF
jgi:hypothetical protein